MRSRIQAKHHIVTAVSAVGLSVVSLSGCSGLAHEAQSPAVRSVGREIAERAIQGGRTVERQAGTVGRVAVQISDVQTSRSIVTTGSAGTGTYRELYRHRAGAASDGIIEEDEIISIECLVDAIKQAPDGSRQIQQGDSVLQKGPSGEWVYAIIKNNLSDVAGGELDPCTVVLSTLPGA